jgi:uncharacterized protein (TIGR03083 family)
MSAGELLRSNDQRFRVLAGGLTDDDWAQPSLCEDWSNHDVLAHLVLGYRKGALAFTAEMLRQAGSFDRANARLARGTAEATTPAQLLDEFDRLIDHPRGLGRYFPRPLLLGDHVTHELDIIFALNLEPSIPVDTLIAVLNTQVAVPNPFVPAFRNSRGLRLIATDADWAHGEKGPVVHGRAAELVSVLGGRPQMLPQLRSDGVELLASRVSRSPIRKAG